MAPRLPASPLQERGRRARRRARRPNQREPNGGAAGSRQGRPGRARPGRERAGLGRSARARATTLAGVPPHPTLAGAGRCVRSGWDRTLSWPPLPCAASHPGGARGKGPWASRLTSFGGCGGLVTGALGNRLCRFAWEHSNWRPVSTCLTPRRADSLGSGGVSRVLLRWSPSPVVSCKPFWDSYHPKWADKWPAKEDVHS